MPGEVLGSAGYAPEPRWSKLPQMPFMEFYQVCRPARGWIWHIGRLARVMHLLSPHVLNEDVMLRHLVLPGPP